MAVRRMSVACSILETTETHSEYVNNYCFSSATVVARTHFHVTLYVHCLSGFSTLTSVLYLKTRKEEEHDEPFGAGIIFLILAHPVYKM